MIVKPPRKIWPYLNEEDNFLLPQALPVLGAVIRKNIPNTEIKIIDCLPYKIGWKKLIKIIEINQPDFLLLSEPELVWVKEATKLAKITKKLCPKTTIIAGGLSFSFLPEYFLKNHQIDYVVIGEGEETIVELIKCIKNKKNNLSNLKKIDGLAFLDKKNMIKTKPRKLIKNLDHYPIPAYDLMNMKAYGRAKDIFHPGSVTIYHSKGCPFSCEFCVCWVSNADPIKQGNKYKYKPCYRSKSVERTVQEIELLYYKYGSRGLVFTDDNWNHDPKWSRRFAEEILKRKLKFNWYAFMRADNIVRDEKLGILKLLVKAGLSHVAMGVERLNDNELKELKNNYNTNTTFKAFKILKNKYPKVFRHGTFIIGTRNESKKSMLNLVKQIKKLDIDMPSFSPLTPLPGTKLFQEAKKKGWLKTDNFEDYDWFTPVMDSKYLDRDEIEDLMYFLNRSHFSFIKFIKNLLSPYKYKRKMYKWFVKVTLKIMVSELKENILHFRKIEKNYSNMIKPKYYD